MKSVTGVFRSRSEAEYAAGAIQVAGTPGDRITVLTPNNVDDLRSSAPTVAAEQPGMGEAIGILVGASAGLAGGVLATSAVLPAVGPITATGLLGGAVLAAAGAGAGAIVGTKLEDSMTEGLPEDELFVYEDALRRGRSVVIAVADADQAERIQELFQAAGSEAVDAAREQWWIGLRAAEREHYSTTHNLADEEKFYRLGFEASLHSRMRCREYDQVLSEMTAQVEELERQYPGAQVAEPFIRGYERGRDYYQQLCNERRSEKNKAA